MDTRRDLWNSVNHALERTGLPSLPLESVLAHVGDGARVLMRKSLAAAGAGAEPGESAVDAALRVFLAHYLEHCLGESLPYPGIREALPQLARYRKAVLTNKPEAPARRILEGLDLARHFDEVLGGDNPYGRKPDPAALLHLLEAWRAGPRETAVIGDGAQDARAARAAGAWFLGFLGGMGPRAALLREAPDAVVERMGALPEAVAALETRGAP